MKTIEELFRRIDKLNEIGASLSSERDLDQLLEKILVAAKEITHADGGTLYRVSDDRQSLHFAIVRTDSLGIAFGGASGQPISGVFSDLPLYRPDGAANLSLVAAFAAIKGVTVNIDDAYTAEGFDFSGTRQFDARTGYRSRAFLTVPMRDHENRVIAVLQLINPRDPESGASVVFSKSDQSLAESLASQAAVALTNRQLIAQLELLFDATLRTFDPAQAQRASAEHNIDVPALLGRLASTVSEAGRYLGTTEDLFRRLEQLNDIGASLSSERNIEHLLEKILVAAKQITHADGGTLYRVAEDRKSLHFAIVRTDSLGIAYGGSVGEAIDGVFRELPLYDEVGVPNNSLVAAYAALQGVTVNIADAYEAEGFDFSGTRRFDEHTGYRSQSFLTVPMRNHENEVIAVLQLINALSPVSGEPVPFSSSDQRLAESLASQAAVALTNRQLIHQLEALFEATIRMINSAIDEKSPYTGGHCQRVPELTMMLADAVSETSEGPFAGFKLTEKDRYELRIASLLHDCGKITTPVHVVDKARKLETIFDRIHLIDTRFEVVKRDAEVAKWRAIAGGEPAEVAEANYRAFLAQCDVDRGLLRKSNIGGERMSDDDIAAVHAIAERYRWTGPDGTESPFLNAEELENLTIRAGTLTENERHIINYHIVATIKMLEQLPWPKHLRNVPEYAGGHHERMDGKGYPKGLRREQMSVQARMMGIADIFEALTATDRPYKQGMSVEQALKILENFRNNGHIDPDLHEIFVRSGVGRRYGEMFLG